MARCTFVGGWERCSCKLSSNYAVPSAGFQFNDANLANRIPVLINTGLQPGGYRTSSIQNCFQQFWKAVENG